MTLGSSLERVRRIFDRESSRHGLRGAMGVASFHLTHDAILPVQQRLLEEAAAERLAPLMERGSFITIAYAYPRHAIDAIAVKTEDGYDKERWNVYAIEYRRLNDALDKTAARLADETGGIALPATVMGVASEIDHVEVQLRHKARLGSHRSRPRKVRPHPDGMRGLPGLPGRLPHPRLQGQARELPGAVQEVHGVS